MLKKEKIFTTTLFIISLDITLKRLDFHDFFLFIWLEVYWTIIMDPSFPEDNTSPKTKFFFPKCSWEMAFPKILHWNMVFSVSSVNMGFLFPENMVLLSRRKMEDDPPKNVHWNLAFSMWTRKMIFPFSVSMILLSGQKLKDDPTKKYIKRWHFLYLRLRWYSSQKIHYFI